ncbi:PAS domain-containing sensor histidine kinase [Cohnella herbarum]|uniref:histidine kinase n=1 Tax=Cohnella herbarum TaxID=2728023 RepID=A0A7Z2ZPH3_9BACL|nr:PAS domain-containing sensor histidine kinase [Cohnella herbarum]QJD87383.1 PAS domain S-box protein [Cohnella herbarum]
MTINNNNLLSDVRNKLLVLDSFLNLTSDAVYVIDTAGKVLEVNKKFEEFHGWTRDEIIGNEMPLSPEERIKALQVFERIAKGEKVTVIEAKKITKSGGAFYTDVTISPVNDADGALIALIVIERDITCRKLAEEKIRESEERYRVLVECSPEPIVVHQGFVVVFVNPAAVRLIGANHPDEIIGQRIERFVHPDDRQSLADDVHKFLNEGKVPERKEERLIRLDGEIIYVDSTMVQIVFQGVKSVQLLCRDITDRKKAVSELEVKEREYSRVLQLSPEPIILHQAGIVTFINNRGIKLLRGSGPQDFVGYPVIDFFCSSYLPLILERMEKVVQTNDYMDFIEMKIKCLDGEIVDVEVSSVCVHRHIGHPIVQVVIRDLTERKKTEEMIRRSDKLSIAGELAAGVAHEIRNPLTSLRGFMQLLREKNTDYVDIMLGEIDRINDIVNEFIGMAKPQTMHFVVCDLRDLIEQVLVFMQPQATMFNVQMNLTLLSPRFSIECEPNQIKQVFMNVLKNAIEAMPNGGMVEITIYMKDQDTIATKIADQGVGIPADRMERIGEPFFSLKESGTGLGLMICHRIVEAHKGKIEIRSIVNVGTTMEVELPVNKG